MLYRPEAFEPITHDRWDAEHVRAGIREIVADTDAALRGPRLLWRADDWDRWHSTSPMKTLYVGAAGVLWALDELRRRGHAESRLDLPVLAARTVELFRERPDYMRGVTLPEPRGSSLLCGETGILLVAWRLRPSADLARDLLARIRENVANEAEEVMWGTPGTLVAARLMHEWTGQKRWRVAWLESADALWGRREGDGLWTQRLYGHELRGLTPPHGLVGIVQALRPLLDHSRRRALERDAAAILGRTAIVEDGLVNWPPRERPELAEPDGQIRLQWCAGAPRIVRRSCVPGQGPARGRRRARLAGRPARAREGRLDLPRHGRQRLRAARGLRPYGGRALARAGAAIRRPRARTGPPVT